MKVGLHGFTGTPAVWRAFPCHALPLPGHSPQTPASTDNSFANEIRRLTKSLPCDSQELVGYSLGARLSLAIALHAPHRVSSLVLIGVSPGLHSEQERNKRAAADRRWSTMLRAEGIDTFVTAWESLPLWDSQRRLDPSRLINQRQQRLSHDPRQLAHALDTLGTGNTPPMWHRLRELTIPVHLVVGSLDKPYLTIAADMILSLPNSKLSIIDNSGHNPILEQPAAIRALLTSPA